MIELAAQQPNTWGSPSEEELAAIVVALEQVWPKPTESIAINRTPVWRFSGRWF